MFSDELSKVLCLYIQSYISNLKEKLEGLSNTAML